MERLVKRLSSDNVDFIIHVDKKTNPRVFKHLAEVFSEYPNVHFSKRTRVEYTAYGHLKATLFAIDVILMRGIQPDYVFLLTGQDYPIKSNLDIQNFLSDNKGKAFINFTTIPNNDEKMWLNRIAYYHINLGRWHLVFPKEDMWATPKINQAWNKIINLFPIKLKRNVPGGFTPYFGGAYWCLPFECVQYVINFERKNDYRYLRFFRSTRYSMESYFQTILANSPWINQMVNNDLHYIDWSNHKNHPEILTVDDFLKLMDSPKLFARKFDVTVNQDVLDMIDNQISRSK